MNTKVLIGLSFTLGLGLGVSLGFALGKKSEKREMEEKVRELREHYNRKTKCRENEDVKEELYKKLVSNYNGSENKREGTDDISGGATAERLVSKIMADREKAEEILAEGEHPEEEYDEDMSKEEIDMAEWESKSIWNSEKRPPYVITFSEFEDHDELDKITLIYYTVGGTLTTEDDEMIEDVRGTVGTCIEDSNFGESEDRVMFVRNKRLGSDFEITKFDGSFY